MRVSEVTAVEVEGPRRFEFVATHPVAYTEQRRRLSEEFGCRLPEWHKLAVYGDRLDLRVLCRTVTVTVTFSDSSWVQVQFLPGFITDLASVPRWVRGLIDNDDPRLLTAVLVHDYLFSTHRLGFRDTNELFYQLAREGGYPGVQAMLAYIAVGSPVGRYRWRINARRGEWHEARARWAQSR
jgi:hypothetical protein